jgi:hypothetical protein
MNEEYDEYDEYVYDNMTSVAEADGRRRAVG